MTTEEKRKAIADECNNYEDCDSCPHDSAEYCCNFNSRSAKPEIIDPWYANFFEGGAPYVEQDETPHILDSGGRREFESGAVRDIQEGKGRCDLMPLDVVADLTNDEVIRNIYEFQANNDPHFLAKALGVFIVSYTNWCPDGYYASQGVATMVLEVSKHFEEGAKKYGEHNWQKGIPTHCYIDSAVRHYLKHLRGDTDEPHDRAFVWNILCCIWTCIHKPEFNDYGKEKKNDND
jgi:hypothetical protein